MFVSIHMKIRTYNTLGTARKKPILLKHVFLCNENPNQDTYQIIYALFNKINNGFNLEINLVSLFFIKIDVALTHRLALACIYLSH